MEKGYGRNSRSMLLLLHYSTKIKLSQLGRVNLKKIPAFTVLALLFRMSGCNLLILTALLAHPLDSLSFPLPAAAGMVKNFFSILRKKKIEIQFRENMV